MKHIPSLILLFTVYPPPMYPKLLKLSTKIFNSMFPEIGGDV